MEHHTNAYAQLPEKNPFSCKVICGECGHLYSRVMYTYRGNRITKWRCGSTNKTNGHKVCSNRYILEESLFKLFVMAWNEIAGNYKAYKEHWDENLKGTELLRCKTRLIMEEAKKGPIKEFDPKLMIKVMDYIMVFESGELKIRFYDGTEFEYVAE